MLVEDVDLPGALFFDKPSTCRTRPATAPLCRQGSSGRSGMPNRPRLATEQGKGVTESSTGRARISERTAMVTHANACYLWLVSSTSWPGYALTRGAQLARGICLGRGARHKGFCAFLRLRVMAIPPSALP